MKRTVKLSAILIVLCLSTHLSFAQSKSIEKTITLNGKSKTEAININVNKNIKSLVSFAQSKSIEKTITLDGKSKTEAININVNKNMKSLDLNIKCEIDKGFIIIEILSPEKKEKGKLLILNKINDKLSIYSPITHEGKKQFEDKFKYFLTIKDTTLYKGYTPIDNFNSTNGEINKKFSLPTEGEWQIKVKSEKGKGKISIKSKTN
ncbi:hypothetical protein D7030_02985 [Flavobacteriaceae bacterium AU392]|nr:hypothetical protein D1817_09460 [Flavobacteriaceae bacterium]RKM85651.1 hypothetical protein D7030_02985 [Flavobacteriaceae bacterium AU392]